MILKDYLFGIIEMILCSVEEVNQEKFVCLNGMKSLKKGSRELSIARIQDNLAGKIIK